MSRSKDPFDLEEQDEKSSEKKVGIELEDDNNDEIIDLEDIFELPGESADEVDVLNMKSEFLDTEADLDFDHLKSDDEDILEDDILKEFAFPEDDHLPPGEEGLEGPADEDEHEDFLKSFSFDEGPEVETSADSPMEALSKDEEDLDFDVLMDFEKKDDADAPQPVKAAIENPLVVEAPENKPLDSSTDTAPDEEEEASLAAFVAQIESKLVETVREMVESRLPELVRTMLREEIEQLRRQPKGPLD